MWIDFSCRCRRRACLRRASSNAIGCRFLPLRPLPTAFKAVSKTTAPRSGLDPSPPVGFPRLPTEGCRRASKSLRRASEGLQTCFRRASEGLPWASMGLQGFPRASGGIQGLPRVSMASKGFHAGPRASKGFERVSTGFRGLPRGSKVFPKRRRRRFPVGATRGQRQRCGGPAPAARPPTGSGLQTGGAAGRWPRLCGAARSWRVLTRLRIGRRWWRVTSPEPAGPSSRPQWNLGRAGPPDLRKQAHLPPDPCATSKHRFGTSVANSV